MKDNNEKIDFVIPWVDGSDPKWIEEYNRYITKDKAIDARNFRYRDWDNLQYWFRGIEKFTPWVNKIYFITWGHIPKWLNSKHPKLTIVKHEDYIPKEYLPVFNVNPIEINLHRIKGLAEKFVYFNDDTFIIKPSSQERFFKNDLPCDAGIEITFPFLGTAHIRANVMKIINTNFSKRKQFKKNFLKWINFKYGLKNIIKTTLLQVFSKYSYFYDLHMPNSYLKTTFENVWDKNKDILNEASASKFRNSTDISQYLFKSWQLVSGNFYP